MIKLLEQNVHKKNAIPLIGYWGASNKKEIDVFDRQAIDYLENLNKNVKSIYKPGLHFTVILADQHAKYNGYKKKNYQKYFKELQKLLLTKDWTCIQLSNLWKRNSFSEEKINNRIKTLPKNWWKKIKIKNKLENQAQKHSFLYSDRKGAQFYYWMRRYESNILEKIYPKSIFWAYSNDDMQEIYPNIPTLYLYSLKKGQGTPPWFKYNS